MKTGQVLMRGGGRGPGSRKRERTILLAILALMAAITIIIGIIGFSVFEFTQQSTKIERVVSVVAAEGELYGPLHHPADVEEYTKQVDHAFFHPLIAYPELAFSGYQAQGMDDYFVTVPEFVKIIEAMYNRGYILVDINDVYEQYTNADGNVRFRQKTLMLPKGKTPFIMSIDDMNYYPYMIEHGTVHRLVLDDNGDVAAYTVPPGSDKSEIRRDLALVPILDDFIRKHPDFSHNNARGVIALTGYQGVLGYRTYVKDNPARESEIELAMPVISRLKETGWTFASHSYGHHDSAIISYDSFKADTQKWKDEVEILTGPTGIYIYPFGSGVSSSDPKFKMLSDMGFTMMCTVGREIYYWYANNGVISSRWNFDGIVMRKYPESVKHFFDSAEVLDPARP